MQVAAALVSAHSRLHNAREERDQFEEASNEIMQHFNVRVRAFLGARITQRLKQKCFMRLSVLLITSKVTILLRMTSLQNLLLHTEQKQKFATHSSTSSKAHGLSNHQARQGRRSSLSRFRFKLLFHFKQS